MGVLYHRRYPAHHLERIRGLLRPGSTMVLETLVLPKGKSRDLLLPEERYARMRNVWAVPGIDRLREWVKGARFKKIEVVDVSATTTSEQRSTEWMRFESLEQALEAGEQNLTVEGYPAPVRATLVAVS
jgi:tRNA (mo5U34)-methyltransferase